MACMFPIIWFGERCATDPSQNSGKIVTSLRHACPLLAKAAYCIILPVLLFLDGDWEAVSPLDG